MNQLRRVAYLGGYFLVLGLGYLWAGYLLAIYGAPAWIWMITFAITLHLVWVGPEAIALGVVWVLVLTWMAVLVNTHPVELPWMYAQAWAVALGMAWVQAIALVWMLGFGRRVLKPWKISKSLAVWILLGLVWSTLGLGAFLQIAQSGTPLFALTFFRH